MAKLVVIADDLTGANDTGVQFCKAGLKTTVLLESQQDYFPENIDIVVIDTDSRSNSQQDAERKVREACRLFCKQGINCLYKKIDSTLRGNIGIEILAAYEELKPEITVIAPAYPKNRRSTIGGYQLLDGLPISMTEFSHDPQNPVLDAWIPNLIAKKITRKIGMVPLNIVMEGIESIQNEIMKYLSNGIDWIVFDAVCDENLQSVAKACSLYEKILWVGSAGLAEQIANIMDCKKNSEISDAVFECKSVLIAAGSMSTVTKHQLQLYMEKNNRKNIVIDAVSAVLTPQTECRRVIEDALPLLKQGEVLISCSGDREAIEKAREAGKSIGLNAGDVSGNIASVLSNIVSELVSKGIDGLYLTGGDTAIHCCRVLQATGIEVVNEVIPGIPIGRLSGGPFDGLPIVTKAGAFGEIYAIVNGVKALQGQKYYESLSGSQFDTFGREHKFASKGYSAC